MIALALYAGLYLAIGGPFLPSGPAWAIIFIWFCAFVLGNVVDRVSPTRLCWTPALRKKAPLDSNVQFTRIVCLLFQPPQPLH